MIMADDKTKGASGTDDKGSADIDNDDQTLDTSGDKGKNSVAYETYQKTLKEAKAAKARLKELEDKLAASENDKLSAEGKKDELIAKLRKDHETLSKTHKDTLNSFVFSSLDAQVKEKAASLGCIDLDAVSKLVDLSDIEVDTKTFKADEKALVSLIDGLKKSKPYLFSKVGPKINTKMPNGKAIEVPSGKKLSELTRDEIWAELRSLEQKQ
jgi:hypothetical protein